jgi:hypothetical protein
MAWGLKFCWVREWDGTVSTPTLVVDFGMHTVPQTATAVQLVSGKVGRCGTAKKDGDGRKIAAVV